MPEVSGEMTPEEIERVQQILHARWSGSIRNNCPACGLFEPWEIDETLARIEVFDQRPHPRPIPGGARLYPMVMIACKYCGYSIMFNAVTLGLLKKFPVGTYSIPAAEMAGGEQRDA